MVSICHDVKEQIDDQELNQEGILRTDKRRIKKLSVALEEW